MRIALTGLLMLLSAGCGPNGDKGSTSTSAEYGQAPAATERGGTISVGEKTWAVVPSMQCSVYPGMVVSIAGHAAGDPSLEIVIDYGGPTGARVGGDGSADAWRAVAETLVVEIDRKRVRGTASFRQGFSSEAQTVPGSFDVNCG